MVHHLDEPLARLEARATEARLAIQRTRIRLAQAKQAIARARETVPAMLTAAAQRRALAREVRENLRRGKPQRSEGPAASSNTPEPPASASS